MASLSFKCSMSILLLVAVMVNHRATADVSCSDAIARILPCESFLLSGGASPSIACCSAGQSLDQIAEASQEDRRAICRCLKDAAVSMPVDLAKAAQLPQLCNVALSVTISPNVDCDSL